MKILILSHTGVYSEFKIGSHHYADGLSMNGHDVYYAGASNSLFHHFFKKKTKAPRKVISNVQELSVNTVYPLSFKRNYFLDKLDALFIKFTKSKKEIFTTYFDLIICDYPFFFPVLNFINYGILIYRPTDNYSAMSGDKVKISEQGICKLARKIISTSQTVQKNILQNYGPSLKDKCHVIENGYDSNKFKFLSAKDRKGCVYIGALDYRFDYDALFFLAENNPTVVFDIYGPLPKKYSSEYKTKFTNVTNISFKGPVDYEKVPHLLNKYKVGILPLTETDANRGRSPMKLWEYISCGLNVIYSSIDHVDDFYFLKKYSSYDELLLIFKDFYSKPPTLHAEELIKSLTWKHKVDLLMIYSLSISKPSAPLDI